MNTPLSLQHCSIPEYKVEFYLLYALDEQIGESKGYIRVIHDMHIFSVNVCKEYIAYEFEEFRTQDCIRESWLQFALEKIAIGFVLRFLPDKCLEINPSNWDYQDYNFFSMQQKSFLKPLVDKLDLSSDIVDELKRIL